MAYVSEADEVTAVEMAKEAGIGPKVFRDALRKAKFPWHTHREFWTVTRNSPQHDDMRRVLNQLISN